MDTTRIGWIGLGNMGIPMSQQLINAGYKVTVYNRNVEKSEALKAMGVNIATSATELIQHTDIVFIMVSDDNAVDEIFNGDKGLLKANVSGKLIINMSTISPGISRKFADLCLQSGNSYLDAPVSGSVKQAQEGQLVIMAGGDPVSFERAKPLFGHLGKLSMLVGAHGFGNSAKLSMNVLLAFYAQGLAETVLFAKQNGIETDKLMVLIANSAMGNIFTKIKGDAILDDNYTAAFALKHIAKDLRLAKANGLETPLAKVAFETFQDAEEQYGNEDIIAVVKHLSEVVS